VYFILVGMLRPSIWKLRVKTKIMNSSNTLQNICHLKHVGGA